MSFLKVYQKYFVLFGGFLLHLSIGNLYTYNNMSSVIVSYMNNYSLSKGNVDSTNAVWIFSLSVFGLGSSVTLGGMIANKIGPSLTVLIGGWFMSINVLLMSYTIKSYLWVVIISYGVLTGIGSGLVYGVTIGTVLKWFPTRRGLICGIVVSGFGFSAFVFDLIFFTNQSNNDDVNIPTVYVVVGGIYILLQFFGSLLLTDPKVVRTPHTKAEVGELSSNIGNTNVLSDSSDDEDATTINVKPHHIYLELDYWVMWISYALLSACITLVVSMSKDFGLSLGILETGKITPIFGLLFNALCRIGWGMLIDKLKYKRVILIMTISLSISFGTLNFISYVENKKVYYFIWIAFLYSIPSGIFSIFPYNCCKLFGLKYFVSNYGLLFTAYSFGGLITGIIYTFSAKNFTGMLIAGCLMSALAGLITVVYRGRSLVHRLTLFS